MVSLSATTFLFWAAVVPAVARVAELTTAVGDQASVLN